jgi:hypothetical protein
MHRIVKKDFKPKSICLDKLRESLYSPCSPQRSSDGDSTKSQEPKKADTTKAKVQATSTSASDSTSTSTSKAAGRVAGRSSPPKVRTRETFSDVAQFAAGISILPWNSPSHCCRKCGRTQEPTLTSPSSLTKEQDRCQHHAGLCHDCLPGPDATFRCAVCLRLYCTEQCLATNSACAHRTCRRCSAQCKLCFGTTCVTCLKRCLECYVSTCPSCAIKCSNCAQLLCLSCLRLRQGPRDSLYLCAMCSPNGARPPACLPSPRPQKLGAFASEPHTATPISPLVRRYPATSIP